jgi:cobalamin-dependent methionine synthase I
MFIIGERLNSTRKSIKAFMEARDVDAIRNEAKSQAEVGASMIDINAGAFVGKELEYFIWLMDIVQEAVDLPLSLDSPDSAVIEEGLKRHKNGKAMINSITGEEKKLKALLPLFKKYDCSAIALCLDDDGIPETAEKKFELASKLIEHFTAEGIKPENIFIDPIIQPVSTGRHFGPALLDAVQLIKEKYPDVHTICGLSNVSYGLPYRKHINRIFLAMAMAKGLDSVILDPCDEKIMATLFAANTLLGKDEYCKNYLKAKRDGRLECVSS